MGDDDDLQLEVLKLEDERRRQPENVLILIKLAHLTKSAEALEACIVLYLRKISEAGYIEISEDGALVLEIGYDYWKFGFENNPLNYSHERREYLKSLIDLISRVESIAHHHISHRFSYYASLVHESYGNFSKALIYLSELISLQVKIPGVNLSVLILRAATLLIFLNRYDEAIEYLEYLDDDDIIKDFNQRVLIISLLHISYKHSNHHKWLLPQTEEKMLKYFTKSFNKEEASVDIPMVYSFVSDLFLHSCAFTACLILLREVGK